MNKNIFMFLSVALVLLIPVPGRFAYGLVMLLEFVLLMVTGILFRYVILKIKMDEYHSFLIPIGMVAVAIIYKQIWTMISPVMAFTIGYVFYMPAVSAFLLEHLVEDASDSLVADIKKKLLVTLSVSLPVVIVFVLRDLIGFGTFTLPAADGLFTLHVIPRIGEGPKYFPTVFLASIPGALLSLAVCIIYVNKFGLKWIKKNSGVESAAPAESAKVIGASSETSTVTASEDGSQGAFASQISQTPAFDELKLSDGISNVEGNIGFPETPSLLNLQDLLGDTNVD